MTLIEWVFGIGGIVLGIGLAAYGFGYKLPGLWIGFFGSVALLLAFTLEIQELIQSATVSGASEPERPSVFVIEMSMAYAEGRVLDHGVMIPTVIEQPTVLITVRSVDRTAFDVDTASGFLIDKALPPKRPEINPPDNPTPGVPIPSQDTALFRAVCPFKVSNEQMESIAHKREFFMVY